jgi:hypothetical protein
VDYTRRVTESTECIIQGESPIALSVNNNQRTALNIELSVDKRMETDQRVECVAYVEVNGRPRTIELE